MKAVKLETRDPGAAKACEGIQSTVEELTRYAGALSRMIQTTQTKTLRAGAMPAVWYSELHLHCGEKRVAMNNRPLLFHLFKTFIDAPGHALSRQDLISLIYPRVMLGDVSNRFRETQAHNLIKLLGRGRDLAERYLDTGHEIRWFVHDMRTGTWRLREYRRPLD